MTYSVGGGMLHNVKLRHISGKLHAKIKVSAFRGLEGRRVVDPYV